MIKIRLKNWFRVCFQWTQKKGIEIFKNHDLRVFHITSGAKKYLWIPISLKNIQERNATVEEREVAFFKKRGTCMGSNWVSPQIISGAIFSAFSLKKMLKKQPKEIRLFQDKITDYIKVDRKLR